MRSWSFLPIHHLRLAVVCCRSGRSSWARACQGMTWASWINGWVGATAMVTGCNGPGLLSPEEQMLMILPSHLELSPIMAARPSVGINWLGQLSSAVLGPHSLFRASDYILRRKQLLKRLNQY